MNIRHSDITGRALRMEEPSELGVSTLKQAFRLLDEGKVAEAKQAILYARQEWEVVHDMYVNWTWSFFSYVFQNGGEEAMEKAMRSVVSSYFRVRYDKAMAASVQTQLELTIEGLRGHLMGAGGMGEVEVIEEEDRYKLMLICSSGGKARERVESGLERFPELFGFSEEPSPLTWGKKHVCHYCAHCALVNEIMAIENYGHPMRITEYPEGTTADPSCIWYIYKDPSKIPAEYYERVGKQAPANAPRLLSIEPEPAHKETK
jgi:hypothetical protein